MSDDIRKALIVIASTRASQGVYEDTAGPILTEGIARWGFTVSGPQVVADGEPVRHALVRAVAQYDLIVTSGGTGVSPTDVTPEMTRPLLDREIPGIPEMLRAYGVSKGVPTSALSRGLAGVSGGALIINLPGSKGAVKDAVEVLGDVVRHAVEQVAGGDHPRGEE
ncbi:MogA/MoaB family molybdenum cofactor biosynthesis protein [Spelaeicoccus albus]|uniref:Molybdenum cofactor synthesis domain-containing protein n=1 Tax=Spelaeicoccus albus TaxID=1280376 RepID=A0A7Z0D199_9MICO|nr:MogA/MoaB family molybdenum cofactor biosynthesis protein [Spelaeicoccus albus]NYI65892.1 molybdenum cofactor synthesis domain-containing protein [Spelaeicoccus albus]